MLIEQEPDINYENARRAHHEYYAPALVNTWWLRLFCAGLLGAVLLLALGTLRTTKQLSKQKVIVLNAAPDGSFDRVQYVSMADYQPGQKVLEHFAYVWAVKYYSRVRATISDDYTESLQFFSPAMVEQLKNEAQHTQWIQNFQDHASDPEVRVEVKKIRLEHGGMTIDLDKRLYLQGRELADKKESWTSQFAYSLIPLDHVSNSMIPVNPIGLRITSRPVETKGF
jgi:hypothetical protein